MAGVPESVVLDHPVAQVVRRGRHAIAVFKKPVQVLSTCARNGGLREDLTAAVNHQSVEGARHESQANFILGLGPEGYQTHVCTELGLDAARTAVMGTAATMQYLGVASRAFADFSLSVVVTAGVQGNAGCAGDPAKYDEQGGRWVNVEAAAGAPAGTHHGTINTLVLIDAALSAAALARAVVTMTEAKSAALQQLAVGSKSSRNLATGTGTDQFVVAARRPVAGEPVRTWSGHHTKLGELLGAAVIEATLEALRWQNGLEPSLTRSLVHALGRFGLNDAAFRQLLFAAAGDDRAFVEANLQGLLHEPQAAAAAYALAAVADRCHAGTLSTVAAHDALLNQLALLAEAHSAQNLPFAEARATLGAVLPATWSEAQLPAAVVEAVLLGFRAKWKRAV